jgi:hypothetical protein
VPEQEQEGVRYFCAEGTSIFVDLQPDTAGTSRRLSPAGPSMTSTRSWMSSRRAGLNFEHYDQPGIRTNDLGVFDGGDFRAAWIKDPDGASRVRALNPA